MLNLIKFYEDGQELNLTAEQKKSLLKAVWNEIKLSLQQPSDIEIVEEPEEGIYWSNQSGFHWNLKK